MNQTRAINRINYAAIDILERLGNNKPSQSQIDLVEAFILAVLRPSSLSQKILVSRAKNDPDLENILCRNFLCKTKNLSSEGVFLVE